MENHPRWKANNFFHKMFRGVGERLISSPENG
jgi:hypothetical protein